MFRDSVKRLERFKFVSILVLGCVFVKFLRAQEEAFSEFDYDSYYCEPDLCKIWNGTDFNFVDHIACGNNGSFHDRCQNASMVEMNQRRMNLILDLHNAARNRIALGLVPGYEPAENMPVLKWDNELQYLASLNVKTCKFAHDTCRNTAKFEFSGQNIGVIWQWIPIHSNSKRIKHIVGKWFTEYLDANQTFIDDFHFHPKGKAIGHFTMLVSDRAQRVGCAANRFTDEKGRLTFLMTCNYDFNSLFGEPIYRSGPAASNCTYRNSGRYKGLCDWDNDYEDSEESNEIDNNLLEIPELL